MRVMLLHKLAEHIPEDYVPPQKPIGDVGKMVSDARDAGLLRVTGGAAPNFPTASELPLLGSNQDSPNPEGPLSPAELQQLAALYASLCHPMLEFAGFHARLCRTLLAQTPRFSIALSRA